MQQKTMKRLSSFGWYCCLIFLVVLARSQEALATPPSTPITLDLALSHAPGLSEQAIATVTVQSIFDAPDTSVELILPSGAVAQTQTWVVDLTANVPVTFTSWIAFQEPGNQTVSARALKNVDAGVVWGDMKSIPLYISPTAAPSERGWRVEQVPVASLAERGDTDPVSTEPTPFSFSTALAEALSPEILPSVEPTHVFSKPPSIPGAPAAVTLTGRWQYTDRSGVTRDIVDQVIEIRRGDGAALNPRVFCFTGLDGTFSCPFTHPGTTMRVWVRSWTNFNRPGGTDRLGVFSGIEVTGGCGSDSIDCSYPVQTGIISCADGTTCNVGTWVVLPGEPHLGAHQMTQDLIRSWKKIFFDPKHGTGVTSGPGRITYPVPAGHGTHAHVPPADGWISIEPPNQQSADIVNHEYGHVVMANKWAGFTPNWPTSDCPSPHFINRVSGPGCALSEGFANFWAWYSNEFYDGDNTAANDGPIFNFPGGGQTNMETRDNGTYDAGDRVEGNVAGVMGDFLDLANESPAGQIFADNLSDRVQHTWHVTSSQSDNNFSEWWTAYWSTFGHNRCHAAGILLLNSINYANPCPDLIVQSITTNPVSPIAGQPVNVTVTVRNQGTAAAGSFFIDWYANRATPPPGFQIGQISCNPAGLAAGATFACNGAFTYATAGTFNMWAQVDTDQQVAESNENNNVRGPQAIVVRPPIDLIVQSITTNPVSPFAGQPVNVTVTVRNQGTAAAGSFFIDWYANRTTPPPGFQIGQISCNPAGLAAGATFACNGAFTYATAGTFNMWAQVDTDRQVAETNEGNNILGPQAIVVQQPFNYNLTNSGAITVIQGASGSNTITATLVSGATQAVSFAASGLPAGATPTFSPAPASCSPTCSKTLTIATTGATPIGTFPITVTGTPLNRTTTFNLVVNPQQFTLTVNLLGTGSGTVTSTDGAIDCPLVTCIATYNAGTNVTLNTAPDAGSFHASWDACSGTNPCTVTMNAVMIVTATFDLTLVFFTPPTDIPTGGIAPSSVAVANADFNLDGIADLAVSNAGSNDVSVFLGDGLGGFAPAPGSPIAVGTAPSSVKIGDFNIDGIPDVVVANAGSNDVTVLLGDGLGGFTPAGPPIAVGTNPSSVAVADPSVTGDLNGDFIADLVVANAGSNDVTVLLGDGLGGFTPAGPPIAAGTSPSSVRIRDFNGDFIPDIAAANQGSNDVTVLLGDGLGGFAPGGPPIAAGTSPSSLVDEDFNFDGIPDLAVTNAGNDNVSILLGDGVGGFTPALGSPFGVGNNPSSVAAGDFNLDGIADLATANAGSNSVYILLGDGIGGFFAGANFPVGTNPLSVAAGDFNLDGFLDLVTANQGSNDVSVVLGP